MPERRAQPQSVTLSIEPLVRAHVLFSMLVDDDSSPPLKAMGIFHWRRAGDAVVTLPLSGFGVFGKVPDTGEIDGIEAAVCLPDAAEPPVAVGIRVPLNVPFDATLRFYRAALPYEDDLDALANVRVIVTAVLSGRPQRVCDAIIPFVAADGR